MHDITFEYRNKQYGLTAGTGTGAAPDLPAARTWHLTLGPTALTTLPAIDGEAPAALQARAIAWIDAHPDLHDRDRIVLGGG